eukprot:1880423-Rhodomonas_salina.1
MTRTVPGSAVGDNSDETSCKSTQAPLTETVDCINQAPTFFRSLLTFAQSSCSLVSMGRPSASKQNKQFGVFFANVVTVPVESRNTTVARSGEGSIFYVFAHCFPELVRIQARCGLTQLEFNKYLQTNDFPLIRKRIRRKTSVSPRKKLAFFPPSSFRFAGRRWRNPDTVEDLAYLCSAWPVVTKGLNAIPFEGFIDLVRQAILLDDERGEMDAGCETLSACSTPANRRTKSHFEESDVEFDSEGEGEVAEEFDSKQDEQMLALSFPDDMVSFVHDEPIHTAAEIPVDTKVAGPKRRVSEKWIDAQTFLEQCKAELPLGGLDIGELLALVKANEQPCPSAVAVCEE